MPTTSKRKRKQIHLAPVEFPYAATQPATGATIKLFPHQQELFEALTATLEEVDRTGVYVLSSMTGSGKTIANILPAVARGDDVILTYPTNALVEDQYRSIAADARRFGFEDDIEIRKLRASDIRSEQYRTHKPVPNILYDWFESTLQNKAHLFLTTPDTFYNIINGKYWQSDRFSQPMDRAHEQFAGGIDYLVFDEFHTYGIESEVSLLNLATILQQTNRTDLRLPLVFSSATSEPQLEQWLETVAVDKFQCFSDKDVITQDGDYRIAGDIELTIEFGPQWDAPSRFYDTHAQQFDPYPSANPLTAIFESATRTLELIDKLETALPATSEYLAYNTGAKTSAQTLTDPETRLQVGTRTLSVGVDFDTDYLYYESYRARDFLQKLGRVGRRGDTATAIAYTSEYALTDPENLANHYDNRRVFETDLLTTMAQRQRIRSYPDYFGELELTQMRNEYAVSVAESFVTPWQPAASTASHPSLSTEFHSYVQAFRNPGTPQVAIADGSDVRFQNLFDVLRLYEITTDHVVSPADFATSIESHAPVSAHYIQSGTITPVFCLDSEPPQQVTRDIKLVTQRSRTFDKNLFSYTTDSALTLEIQSAELPRLLRQAVTQRLPETGSLLYVLSENQFETVRNALPHLFRTYELVSPTGEEYRVVFGQTALKLWALFESHNTEP